MEGYNTASDQVVAELVGMGFELPDITETIKAVVPSLDDAVEFILNRSQRTNSEASSSSTSLSVSKKVLGKRATSSTECLGKMRQQSIREHLMSTFRPKRRKAPIEPHPFAFKSNILTGYMEDPDVSIPSIMDSSLNINTKTSILRSNCKDEEQIGPNWEQKVESSTTQAFWIFILEEFSEGSSGSLVIPSRLSCSCSNRIWKISVLPNISIINWEGGCCCFTIN